MKIMDKLSRAILLVFVLVTIQSCGGSSDDNNVDPTAAKSTATQNISGNLSSNLSNIDTLLNSSAFTTLSDSGLGNFGLSNVGGVNIPLKSVASNKLVRKLQKLQQRKLPTKMRKLTTLQTNGETDQIASDVEQFLDQLLANPSTSGNTITYSPDVATICADEPDQQSQTDCENTLQHITIVQTVISDTEGTLALKYDDYAPFVIGYASTSVYFEINLGDLKDTVVALDELSNPDSTAANDLPETFKGAIRLTLAAPSETEASITFGITQAIDIAGTANGDTFNTSLGVADEVFKISANAQDETGEIKLGLGTVDVSFPVTDQSTGGSGTDSQGVLHLGALQATYTVSDNGNTLVATEVGIGETMAGQDPMTIEIGGTRAWTYDLTTYGFTVDGTTQTVTYNTAYYEKTNVTNISGAFSDTFPQATDPFDASNTGSLTVDFPINTALMVQSDGSTKVTAGGPVEITGTDYFTNPIDSLTVNMDECFNESTSFSATFPVESVTCP
jgi:hypothetical protein